MKRLSRNEFNEKLRDFEGTYTQTKIIEFLLDNENVSFDDISNSLNIPKSTIIKPITQLRLVGLVRYSKKQIKRKGRPKALISLNVIKE